MAFTISITLQKGGTGKSTTATTLASILGEKKNRVLLLDMDSQVNASIASGFDMLLSPSITDVLASKCDIKAAIRSADYYDIILGDQYLANLESIDPDELNPTLLRELIYQVSDKYDYIIIDTPPALGNILKQCMMASDGLIIPIEARPFALNGLDALQETIESVRKHNKALQVLGILLVKYNSRTVLNRQVAEALAERAESMQTTVFNSYIREGIAVPESQILGQPLIDYAPNSKPAQDYRAFANEVIKRVRGEEDGDEGLYEETN